MIEKYFTQSRTKPRLLDTLTLVSMVRYITFKQLKSVKKPFTQHIATKKSLQQLVDLGFLELIGQTAYSTTKEATDYLKLNGINTAHFQQ